jgi:hypothetical protein
MAAASAPRPSGLIDPLKGMKYPIQLGESVSKDPAQGRYYSVKCKQPIKDQSRLPANVFPVNHKPKHTSPNQKTTITPSDQSHKYKLVITDDGPSSPSGVTYKYQGTLDPHTTTDLNTPNHSYGLVFSQEKNAFVLERISTDLHFNLVSNPGTATKSQLAQQYPQLELQKDPEVEEEDELFQDGASYKSDSDVSMADEENPYDYRHFLPDGKYAQAKERTDMSRSQSPNLGASSPYLGGRSPHPNGYLSATSPALKPKPKAKPQPLISKPTPRPTASTASAKPKSTPSSVKPRIKTPPRIVEEGLYSPHSSSDSDSDSDSDRPKKSKSKSKGKHSSSDLIIDLGSPPPEKKRKPLHRPKNAQKPGVPISFREATSASENEGDADESGLDVDMGGDVDAEGDVDADYEMDDEDVEILKLPSPARIQDNPQTNSGDAVGLGLGGDMMDEEDDLAAALTMELEKDMAEEQTLQQDEESEVSEEE